MDFDIAKENIQPLASGRNAEYLETALSAESDQEIQQKVREKRKEFEKFIETYNGDDPLQPWYDYIIWLEQIYPKSGKESALHDLLSKCLAFFENDERYFQDRRMVKLYIKYIDAEPNPPQFYEQLYKSGIGTMIADLYLCWAHYYDYIDNFKMAEDVYRKGLDARAEPIELIEQAHRQFGFSMSQRILHKDDETAQKKIRSSMDERRLALTSLRAHKHRHVGSIRTGPAVKSYNPGRVDQQSSSGRQSNRKVQVFEDGGDAPTSPVASTSVVQSILNSTKKQENMREPGPWNKAKIKSRPLFSGVSTSKPSFSILEDDDIPPIPLPESDNNFARGIQLPNGFSHKNLPQAEFDFPIHRDEEPARNTLYKYDKFMVFPAADKCYSLEELSAYKWFKKNKITNSFTRTQDKVWDCGYDIPIRLPPHFVRQNAKQEDWSLDPIDVEDATANGKRQFGFNIQLIYNSIEEYSPDEILQSKWLNGELISQKGAEMEITCGFERREDVFIQNARRRSMALGGRKSILPRKSDSPRKSFSSRKSLAAPTQPDKDCVEEEPQSSSSTGLMGKRTSLPKRKSIHVLRSLDALSTIPETASPPALRRKLNEDEAPTEEMKPNPIKFNIFEDGGESTEAKDNDHIFKVPQSGVVQKPRVSSVFQDEDLDGCTTQTFNFFIKSQSISTPKFAKPHAKIAEPDNAALVRKGLDFDNDSDEMEPIVAPTKQPFAYREIETDPHHMQMIDQHELYRQKLSAIMETTEEGATLSSLAATASSKSSSADEFDSTKHTNPQSSIAMSTFKHHTIANNTTKMTSMNVSSAVNRENDTKKSALGFEIYQEETLKADDAVANQMQTNVETSPKKMEAFDKTLPPTGQFHIYEDENKQNVAPPPATESNVEKVSTKLAEVSILKDAPEKSVFEISTAETMPSAWISKSAIDIDVSLAPNKSKIETVNTVTQGNNMTLAAPSVPSGMKTAFQIFQEDTGLTLPVINFTEETTEKIPPLFNANQTNFMKTLPPMFEDEKTEAVSIFMPEIPELDITKNETMSKIAKADISNIEATKAVDQSVAYNRSIFQFPPEETVTNVFATNYNNEGTGNISKLPNPMQISMMNIGNLSAFPMIPEMPTLPEIDFESETLKQQSSANRTKADTTLNINDKTNVDKSMNHEFQPKLDCDEIIQNKSTISRKFLNETKPNEMSKFEASGAQVEPFATVDEKANQTKTNISTMINSSQKPAHENVPNVAEKSSFALKSLNKSKIDDEIYAAISPPLNTEFEKTDANKSLFSKSKHAIDDEFYAMIKSPIRPTERSLAKSMLIIDTPSPPPAPQPPRESIVADTKIHTHQILQLRDSSVSLLEPKKSESESMRDSLVPKSQTIFPIGRNSSTEDVPRAFSDENPNTALFSLHMPFIKNSTILMKSNENLHNISEDLANVVDKSHVVPELDAIAVEKSIMKENTFNAPATNEKSMNVNQAETSLNLKLNSIHIKEERLSTDIKMVESNKPATNIDDELYECIKVKESNTPGFLNLSIQLTEVEMAETNVPKMENTPKFLISNPVSIRPSQFPMNETTLNETNVKDTGIEPAKDSTRDFQMNLSKVQVAEKPEDASLIVVEDTEDLSSVSRPRRETMHSPFKNRYATNPKLNETISAVKEIDPFDIHLQNALLDDIDFIEYIKSLDYVHITTRVRAIELDKELEIGDETFQMIKQIGQGSFGFVYSGKSTKTGKLYAFKQERPANFWEFYISLEIATRVEDAKILPGFMSVQRAIIGHNSSIFVNEYCKYGSLFDVCNHHKLNTCRYLDEVIAMIFSEQMLSILDHLHASNIIHGDIKPDNFLLMKKLSYGSNDIVIKLIDYGQSIDLNFFPPNQTFTSALHTKNFVCTEMMEKRPWKNQVDLFCLASTMYTLICGKYMNVKKQPDSKLRPYVLSENLPPYLNVQLWEQVLYSLINVRDHNTLPDLQKLRLQIREAIIDIEENIVQDKISKFNAVLDS